mmetsp:Transcript_30623/g.51554  ORF Transcript_30623/g.51554 Transcript_30623/m.51554 type:complete len:230 (-) Transcript_30623:161-850(-)
MSFNATTARSTSLLSLAFNSSTSCSATPHLVISFFASTSPSVFFFPSSTGGVGLPSGIGKGPLLASIPMAWHAPHWMSTILSVRKEWREERMVLINAEGMASNCFFVSAVASKWAQANMAPCFAKTAACNFSSCRVFESSSSRPTKDATSMRCATLPNTAAIVSLVSEFVLERNCFIHCSRSLYCSAEDSGRRVTNSNNALDATLRRSPVVVGTRAPSTRALYWSISIL